MTCEGAQGLPYSTKLEDSTDQLVRIEASPTNPVESKRGAKRKESKRRKKSGALRSIKVSPVKSQASPDRLAQNSSAKRNKHHSPCHLDEISKEQADSILQLQPVAVSGAGIIGTGQMEKSAKRSRTKDSESPTAA